MSSVLADKILVLGVDGMEPVLTKRLMDEGKLPNIESMIKRGAAREDLHMLGAVPTITPPMWTTLATGAYPMTHGITCFWGQSHEKLDTLVYNLDSRRCKAEQLWNVTAEAGMKTLVWHWPGSSWPPSSNSPNLNVVDGIAPNTIGMGNAIVQQEEMVVASAQFTELIFAEGNKSTDTGAGCIITDLPPLDLEALARVKALTNGKEMLNVIIDPADGEAGFDKAQLDLTNSPIKTPQNWQHPIPSGAKEFAVITSSGLVNRPGLIIPNAEGVYDTVALYHSKREAQPFVVLVYDQYAGGVDEVIYEDKKISAYRLYKLLEIEPDGSKIKIFMTLANDIAKDDIWYPKRLYRDVVDHVGHVPPGSMPKADNFDLILRTIQPNWEIYTDWQARALNYLMDTHDYQVIFSHLHNIDAQGHNFWHFSKPRSGHDRDPLAFQQLMENVYIDTDKYIGSFLHYLDKGWTILVTSDHGLIAHEVDEFPLLGDAFGTNVIVMQELGYTALIKDDEGNFLKEVDWSNTRAIASRGNHIWLNLKSRNSYGIVDDVDQYDLERQIIDDLYNYRYEGKRIVALALRNKDAVALGLSGSECGDIIYFIDEGMNRLHGDALATFTGYLGTSVSPIFFAAGQGIKANYVTDRVVRQVDFAPTIAALLGVRMPAQCEGAPLYQILA